MLYQSVNECYTLMLFTDTIEYNATFLHHVAETTFMIVCRYFVLAINEKTTMH